MGDIATDDVKKNVNVCLMVISRNLQRIIMSGVGHKHVSYWVRSYFIFLFPFLLEGFPYCDESVHGCDGNSHL